MEDLLWNPRGYEVFEVGQPRKPLFAVREKWCNFCPVETGIVLDVCGIEPVTYTPDIRAVQRQCEHPSTHE